MPGKLCIVPACHHKCYLWVGLAALSGVLPIALHCCLGKSRRLVKGKLCNNFRFIHQLHGHFYCKMTDYGANESSLGSLNDLLENVLLLQDAKGT